MADPIRIGVLGIDHRHIYTMLQNMLDAGGELVGWHTEGAPGTLDGFAKRFPDAPRAARAQVLLDDPTIDLILIAAIPRDRAALALQAMERGKDVMVDKPGCTDLGQLAQLRAKAAETGRIWSVDYSGRFEVPAVTRAGDLVAAGEIGEVIQTTGLGPHRLNLATRPDWFFDRAAYGGILTDIGSHQIDQFLHFTGAEDAEIVMADVANIAQQDRPGLQDFGQVALQAGRARGYVRVDWYTPDALPNWGDGRLFLTGTKGTIELRKYVDVAGRAGTDHLFLVTGERCEHIDCRDAGLPYFPRLAADIRDRTETAATQAHMFKVMELAIKAQMQAEAR